MLQRFFVPGFFAAILLAAPAWAITPKEKMKTCEFGADDQKLTGAARKSFLTKCMSNTDSGPKTAAKKPKAQPQPAQ